MKCAVHQFFEHPNLSFEILANLNEMQSQPKILGHQSVVVVVVVSFFFSFQQFSVDTRTMYNVCIKMQKCNIRIFLNGKNIDDLGICTSHIVHGTRYIILHANCKTKLKCRLHVHKTQTTKNALHPIVWLAIIAYLYVKPLPDSCINMHNMRYVLYSYGIIIRVLTCTMVYLHFNDITLI